MDALVTRGVNVRPRRPRFESCPPRGLTVSGTHWIPEADRRPGGRRAERARLRAKQDQDSSNRRHDRARSEMYAAQDLVRLLKAQGKDFRASASTARGLRAEYLRITGGVESRSLEVSQGASSNPVKAV